MLIFNVIFVLGWNSFANLLYVDQPAGTGFSYVTNPLGYVTNERTIGIELWTMLQEFYKKYPKYAKLDLYIVGESYGKENLHGMYLVCGGNVSGNLFVEAMFLVIIWCFFLNGFQDGYEYYGLRYSVMSVCLSILEPAAIE